MGIIEVRNIISMSEFDAMRIRMDESAPGESIGKLRWRASQGMATPEDLRHLGVPIRCLPQRYEEAAAKILDKDRRAFSALETGAIGVLLVGGGDRYRGAMAAALAVRKVSNRWNAARMFVDVSEAMDTLFSLPLFGIESRSSVLAELKSADILVLHGIDELIERPKGSPAFEEVLRERVRRASGFTIITSEVKWSTLKSCTTAKIRQSLIDLLIVPTISKLNAIELVTKTGV